MGLDINGTKCLLYAKSIGVDFSRTIMIGRQSIHRKLSALKKNSCLFGFSFNKKTIRSMLNDNNGFAESFIQHLGADKVCSIDYSNYEGATHNHDMNKAIPDHFKGIYSVVLDAGSLEHVFNFPVAIKNCMEMVQIGGHFIGITPTNNWMGHGFYQFSPDLFFSIFTEENGYEIVDLIAFEDKPNSKWYSVKNPKEIKTRVILVNNTPTYLFVLARKVCESKIFERIPQQSDYVSMWKSKDVSDDSSGSKIKKNFFLNWIRRSLTVDQKRWIRQQQVRLNRLRYTFNPKFFKPMKLSNKHNRFIK